MWNKCIDKIITELNRCEEIYFTYVSNKYISVLSLLILSAIEYSIYYQWNYIL